MLPLKVRAFPPWSTAVQNDDDGHDTAARPFAASMLAGALQELPLNVSALPWESTAAQNDAEGQETELSWWLPSISAGALHELPLKATSWPVPSTATQNDEVGQETDDAANVGSTALRVDHPFTANAGVGAPTASTIAPSVAPSAAR